MCNSWCYVCFDSCTWWNS